MRSIYFSCIIILGFLLSCNKKEFLNKKPNDALVVPKTLDEIQALLDNDIVMNGTEVSGGLTPALGEAGSDNYFLLETDFNNSSEFTKNIYIWNSRIFTGAANEDLSWASNYRAIFYCNVVLDALNRLDPEVEKVRYEQVKGSALFYRAYVLWQLAQVFAPVYNRLSEMEDWGLPLRKTADVNEIIIRSKNKDTYGQILSDLLIAKDILPDLPAIKIRPSKNSAYAMLARVYLSMQDYQNSLNYSNLSLGINAKLIDYNLINQTSATSAIMPIFNDEVIFESQQNFGNAESLSLISSQAKVDTILYNQYAEADLRKKLFFRDRSTVIGLQHSFRGSYSRGPLFSGLANDELYLIRAECYARNGNTTAAMADINTLLVKRYTTYVNQSASTSSQALAIVLQERRKELLFRGLRWADLRRLNQESQFAKTLARVIGTKVYSLPPNDPRFTYPIPNTVISFHPEMPQNIR